MIGGCLSSAIYTLEADIYTKKRTVDSNTGQTIYKWQFWKTIDCVVDPFVSTSFKTQPINEYFREEYESLAYIKLKTSEELGRSVRVTNIRNKKTQVVVYREIELNGKPATNFNAQGSSPIPDPFGGIIQYDTLLIRATDQSDINV